MIAKAARWFGIAVLGLALLAGLVSAGAWLFVTYDRDSLRDNLEAALEKALGRDVTIAGDIDLHLALRPTVALSDITVSNAEWGASRPMLKLGTLEVTFRLTPILTRQTLILRRIIVTDVDAWVENNPEGQSNWALSGGGDPAPLELREVRADRLRVTYHDWDSGNNDRYEIATLAARPDGPDGLKVDLKGSARELPIDARLSIKGRHNLLRGQGFPLVFRANIGDAELKGYGTLAELDLSNAAGTDVRFELAGTNLQTFQPLTSLDLPETSAFDLSLNLDSDATTLGLDDIEGAVTLADGHIDVKGTVGEVNGFEDMDLAVSASGGNLANFLGVEHVLTRTKSFEASGRVQGSWDAPELVGVEGRFDRGTGILTASAAVKDARRGLGIDATISGKSAGRTLLSEMLGTGDAPIDKAESSMRIVGDWPTIAAEDIDTVWTRNSMRTNITGRIGSIEDLSAFDLTIDSAWDDLRLLEPLAGVDLYHTDTVNLRGSLTGEKDNLTLDIENGVATKGTDRLEVSGSIRGMPGKAVTRLDVRLEGSDLTGLGEDYGLPLPATKAYRLTGRLQGPGTTLDLESTRISASREGLILEAAGRIGDFFGDVILDLGVSVTGQSIAELGPLLSIDLPESDTFRLRGRTLGPVATPRIESFEGSAAKGSAQLSANGRITWAGDQATFEVDGRMSAATLSEAGDVVDMGLPAIPEFSTGFTIAGTPREFSASLPDLSLDDSRASADIRIRVPETGPVEVRGGLTSGTLRLDTRDYGAKASGDNGKSSARKLIPDLAIAGALPANLDLDLDWSGIGLLFKEGQLQIRHARLVIRNGALSLEPGLLDYAGGTLNLNIAMDGAATPARSSLALKARDLNFGQVLTELGGASASGGTLDMDMDIRGSGPALRDQFGAANGSMDILAEGGKVEVADMKLLATDLIFDALPLTKKDSHISLSCLMSEWVITNGQANAGLLFVDGENLYLRGTGGINLSNETVDMLLAPRPKKARALAHNVDLTIKGPLTGAKVKANAAATARKGIVTVGKYVLLGPAGLLIPTDGLAENYPKCASSLQSLPGVESGKASAK